MDILFLVRVIVAFALVAAMLVALVWVVRSLARGRLVVAADRRLVSVVESTFLAQNTTVHVVKVADRYYLVGGGSGGVSLIAELAPDAVDDYIAKQRRALDDQKDALVKLVDRVRGKRA